MACNVCGEENGWSDNPLVYCDGNDGQCSVAVHQACYGITLVPSDAWQCNKCISVERKAKVRCELCPNKDGAFKRTNTNSFTHVICALYIPEVRFGNVCTMEPIILSSIPQDRYNKSCYICEDRGRENKAKVGACTKCNKSGCKQYFHVTCAQSQGLLCEEAGNNDDNVKYCGYCKHHYQKMRKDPNIKFIPAFKPETRSEKVDSSPEKKFHRNSDTTKPPKKKQKFYGNILDDSDHEEEEPKTSKRKRTSSSSKETSSHKSSSKKSYGRDPSPDQSSSDSSIVMPANKKLRESLSKSILDSDTDEEIQYKRNKTTDSDKKKSKKSTSSTTKSNKDEKTITKEVKKMKKRKDDSSKVSKSIDKDELSSTKCSNSKVVDDKRTQESTKSNHNSEVEKFNHRSPRSVHSDKQSEKHQVEDKEADEVDEQQKRSELPKQHFDLPDVIKYKSFYSSEENKSQQPILSFEDLLERQWNQSAQYIMEQNFDVTSLISCLYKLKSENRELDERLRALTTKRDHLISVNSRLSIPLNAMSGAINGLDGNTANQLTSTLVAANSTLNKSNEASNLFFNQNALNQPPNQFSSSSTNNPIQTATSTPSPLSQAQQQQTKQQQQTNNHS